MTFEGVKLKALEEDLREPTRWAIHKSQHVLVVHDRGSIDRLETLAKGAARRFPPPADRPRVVCGIGHHLNALPRRFPHVLALAPARRMGIAIDRFRARR